MLYNVDDASPVDIWGRVWLMTANNRTTFLVKKLASSPAVIQLCVAQVN
jgi:hypothetical protein